jgi:hypothetical protein
VAVQWTRAFNMSGKRRLILQLGSFSFSTSYPLMLYSLPCFLRCVELYLNGYVPPSSEKLKTTLLVKEKEEVDKILEHIKSLWPLFGVSIVSNGWVDATHHPLISFMVSSQNGPVFSWKIQGCKIYG